MGHVGDDVDENLVNSYNCKMSFAVTVPVARFSTISMGSYKGRTVRFADASEPQYIGV